MARTDKCRALYEISMVDFLLKDMELYLDTHPCDKNALDYYRHYTQILDSMRKDYTQNYGPLFACDSMCENQWQWGKEPNAWEGVC